MPSPYLATTDPDERLVWRAILERTERLAFEEAKRLAMMTANYSARTMGGSRRK